MMYKNALYVVCGTRFFNINDAIENAFFEAKDTNSTITIFHNVLIVCGKVLEQDALCEITIQDAQTYYNNLETMRTERNKTRDYELHNNIDAIENALFYLAMKDMWNDSDFAYDKELRRRLAILKA